MKNASFIIGLIAGILGIMLGCSLVFIGLNMKVTNPHSNAVMIFSVLGLLSSISGLVGACIVNTKNKLAGILMIIAAILNLFAGFNSIGADSPLNFVGLLVVSILFLISGIFSLKKKS